MLVTLAVLVAIGGFVLAALFAAEPDNEVTRTGTPVGPGGTAGESPTIVESYVPGRGVEAFQQAQVGLDLAPGWALTDFTLNDVSIPDDELDITRELDRYLYTPGEGKTIRALDPQTNCASALVYQIAVGTESGTRVERWCFEVL